MYDFYKHFKIVTKKATIIPFYPNIAQKHFYNNMSKRDIILKARQLGFTTLLKMIDLNYFMNKRNQNILTIANIRENADEIFDKIKFAFDNLPKEFINLYNIDTNNIRKLKTNALNNIIATTLSARSRTAQRLHVSEFGLMKPLTMKEVRLGAIEAVPENGYCVIESTANGRNGFYDMWKDAIEGKSDWKAHFYNWTWDKEYRKESTNDNWKQDYIQLAKQYNLIIDIEKKLNIDNHQFFWYYTKAKSMREGILQEYPSVWEEAFISTSRPVFNLSLLKGIATKEPIEIALQGDFKVWEKPDRYNKYVLGVDTSEGIEGGDYSVIEVLDIESCIQVAEFRAKIKPANLGHVSQSIAEMYNNALIVIERNNHGHVVLEYLRENYHNLYLGEDKKLGFLTNKKTKNMIILGENGIDNALNDESIAINSEKLLSELIDYEYDKNGSMNAKSGSNDDCVIGLALAWHGTLRNHQKAKVF